MQKPDEQQPKEKRVKKRKKVRTQAPSENHMAPLPPNFGQTVGKPGTGIGEWE